MTVISLENWPQLEDLERTFYEKYSYEQLLSYMANNHIGNHSEYFKEYQEIMKHYYQLCEQLKKEIIFPASNKEVIWEVDFIEKEVKIREIEG